MHCVKSNASSGCDESDGEECVGWRQQVLTLSCIRTPQGQWAIHLHYITTTMAGCWSQQRNALSCSSANDSLPEKWPQLEVSVTGPHLSNSHMTENGHKISIRSFQGKVQHLQYRFQCEHRLGSNLTSSLAALSHQFCLVWLNLVCFPHLVQFVCAGVNTAVVLRCATEVD